MSMLLTCGVLERFKDIYSIFSAAQDKKSFPLCEKWNIISVKVSPDQYINRAELRSQPTYKGSTNRSKDFKHDVDYGKEMKTITITEQTVCSKSCMNYAGKWRVCDGGWWWRLSCPLPAHCFDRSITDSEGDPDSWAAQIQLFSRLEASGMCSHAEGLLEDY